MKNNLAQFDISFSWIFAIIVGIIIIAGAIYGVTKLVGTEREISSAKSSTELINFLSPLETGFESSKSIKISFPLESQIISSCDANGNFGEQSLILNEYINNKWSSSHTPIYFSDKYLFSESISQDKDFYLFSKSFEFPFEVASLVYLVPLDKTYCFKNAPRDIEKELQDLNMENIKTEDCSESDIEVCFENSNCEIYVSENFVEKDGDSMYYETDALMYAAIFSDSLSYECNLQRLMKKTFHLSEIYLNKSSLLVVRGCESDLSSSLLILRNFAENFKFSSQLSEIISDVYELDYSNKYAQCKLW